MSGSRSERQSSRRKLNRKRFLGALLGLTLTVGMFPSSMAVANMEDESASTAPSVGESPEASESATADQNAMATGDTDHAEDSSTSEGSVSSRSTQAAVTIQCTSGYFYSVSSSGQLRQIGPTGTVTNIGSSASGVSSFNGVGIGSGGEPVYAYERTNESRTVTMYELNVSTGSWSTAGDTYNTSSQANGSYSGSLVAGAVNLNNGKYMFGGFQTTTGGQGTNTNYTQVFKIWQYDPSASPKFSYKGYVSTYSGRKVPGATNGDMAFDAGGNLFIVRGSGSETTVFSVTAANLATATGGSIPSSGSSSFDTAENVNGVAFDASGKAYLGASSTVQSFDMPSWSNKSTVTSALSSSTDLASCSSPATITLEKVINGRVSASDQFSLTLSDGATTLGTSTTTGSSNGLQDDRVGPQPTVRGKTLAFSEAGASGTDLTNYATTYQCTIDGKAMSPAVSGSGTSGTVTIPTSGQAVVCQFTNSPLIAQVNITKTVLDRNGANAQPGEGWTMGSTTTATKGTAAQSPSGAQQTGSTGIASWTVTFDKADSAAQVAVSETQKPGYVFVSGQCTVTDNNGTPGQSISLPSASGVTVPQLKPGERLDCDFTNQEQSSTLTLTKVVTNAFGGTASINDFLLNATPTGGQALGFSSGETKVVEPGTYLVGETLQPGYEQESLVCTAGAGDVPVTDSTIQVGVAQDVVCTLTNRDKPGSVTWSKVDEQGSLLAGAVWTLAGPDQGTEVDIEDCVAASATSCTGLDKDPAVGQFKVEDLAWGSYILTEKTAPPGYQRTGENFEFTITGDALEISLDEIANEQQTGVILPLTGGLGRDAFLLGGTLLLLLAGGALVIRQRRARRVQQD
jgi:hypothetical protein